MADSSNTDSVAGPVDVDRSAPVVLTDEIIIDAPVVEVWALHTDVSSWLSWRSDIDRAELKSPFAVGSQFEWATGGLDIASTIWQVLPNSRTVWGGPAAGIAGVHVWEFAAEGERTRVVTTESWAGPPVEQDVERARQMLGGHLATWLVDLKRAAEG